MQQICAVAIYHNLYHNKLFMSDNKKPVIEDAQIITDPENTSSGTVPAAFDITAFNATKEIVKRRLVILDKAKNEIRKLKEMFNDAFINDANYNAADKVVKDAMKKRKDIQAQLARQPQLVELNGKIKDLKEQIKDNEESLSSELMEYYKTAGVTEIEDDDGNVQEFRIIVRLKPKKRAE